MSETASAVGSGSVATRPPDPRGSLLEVGRGESFAQTLDALVSLVEGRFPDMICSILVLDREGRLRHGSAPGLPPAYNRAIDGISIGEGVGSCGTAAFRGEPVIVSDVQADPLWEDYRELAGQHGLRACWSLPVKSLEGEVLGTFAMYYREVRSPGGEEMGLAESAARIAATVIERERAAAALREEAQLVETLHAIGEVVTTELDLTKVVQAVTDAATSLTTAQFGAFFYNLRDERGEAYMLYTLSGAPREAFERFPYPRNTPVFEPTFHGTGVVRSDDITSDPRYGQMAPYHGMPEGHLPVRSYLAVPVISRFGDVLGGLFFGHEDRAVFSERHERIAVGIASWAAVAMDNARLYEAEQRARAVAEEANNAKSDFIATMSHELRTPLNAIQGFAQLLEMGISGPVTEEQAEQVRRIQASSRHLLTLINDVLDLAKVESGQLDVERKVVPVKQPLEQAFAIIEHQAQERRLALEGGEGDQEGLLFRGDEDRVRQILVNLLANAVKFTEPGGRVRVSVERAEGPAEGAPLAGSGPWLTVRVEDTGIGIPPDRMDRIFEPFVQLDSRLTREHPGTGLGLTISRRLARLMGGDVRASSEPGKGSTFTVWLPAARTAG